MTTTAGHSFYIGPIVFFYYQVNDTGSWEPLVWVFCEFYLFCFDFLYEFSVGSILFVLIFYMSFLWVLFILFWFFIWVFCGFYSFCFDFLYEFSVGSIRFVLIFYMSFLWVLFILFWFCYLLLYIKYHFVDKQYMVLYDKYFA